MIQDWLLFQISTKKLGVESDKKAKRIWFRFPKLVGNNGVDLSAIGVRVNFRNANGDGDIYIVEDLTTDGDYVIFSWELTRKVTAYKGNVSFVVCAVKSATDGTIKNEWNTTLNKECEVFEGLEVTEQIEQENPDIIEYILANLGGSVSSEEIAQAVEAYLAENPPSGMTEEEKAQLQKNTEDISSLSEEKVDNPSTGAVGQILEIETVDENGKPKTYKAVDKPTGGGEGLSTDLKTAFINYYTHVMPNFDDTNGLSYVNAILTALGAETRGESGEEPDTPVEPGNPEVTLTSISATYTGGDVTVGTALTDLTGITVTGTYSDGSIVNITDYTLSGMIAEGNNTITVSYGGKTASFIVVGIAESSGEEDGGEVTLLKNIAFDGTSYLDTEIIPETVNYRYVFGVQAPSADVNHTKYYFMGVHMRDNTSLPASNYHPMLWRMNMINNNYNAERPSSAVYMEFAGVTTAGIFMGQDQAGASNNQFYDQPLYCSFTDGEQSVWLDEELTQLPTGGSFKTFPTTTQFSTNANYNADKLPILPIWLGRPNTSSKGTSYEVIDNAVLAGVKFYCFKVYDENDNLIADMRPAKQGNVIGMYCNVREKFYAGNGTLTYEEPEVA